MAGGSHNPCSETATAYHAEQVWTGPFSLATTKGVSLPPGTKMFQFPGCPLPALYIQAGVARHYSRGVSPFGYLRIKARFQLPGAFRR